MPYYWLTSKTDILRSKMTKCQTNLVPKKNFSTFFFAQNCLKRFLKILKKNFFSKNPVFFGPKNGQKWQKSPKNIFFEIRPKFCNRRYMTRPYSKNLWKIDPRDPASPAAGKPEFSGKFRLRNFSSNIIPQLDAKFQKHPTVIQEVRKIDPGAAFRPAAGKPEFSGKFRLCNSSSNIIPQLGAKFQKHPTARFPDFLNYLNPD